MIVAFFESVKYTGHLFPIALLRVFLGYQFLQAALIKTQGEYLSQPILAGTMTAWLESAALPPWYESFIKAVVIPYWQVFAYLGTVLEFAVGLGFLIGFLVRPLAIIACFIALNFLMVGDPSQVLLNELLFGTTLALGWMGAGRCLGVDYFFFKRHRGIWW